MDWRWLLLAGYAAFAFYGIKWSLTTNDDDLDRIEEELKKEIEEENKKDAK